MAHTFAYALRISTLTLCLAALYPATAFPQTSSDVSSAASPTAGPVAYVYVGTSKGVYLYHAGSNGSLSLVSGSPFAVAGNEIGSNGKYFFSLGTNYLHSYAVASNGAIRGQSAQINTALYRDPPCGNQTIFGGTIDRTGTEAYIQFEFPGPYDEGCDSLHSYKIGATGAFTFGGLAEFDGDYSQFLGSPLVIAGNNAHAYTFAKYRFNENEFRIFYRDRFGTMNDATAPSITDPPPNGGIYFPLAMASDNQNLPTSHMAVALHEDFGEPCDGSTAPVVTSYTIDYNGNISYKGPMVKTAINPASMSINREGNLLAAGGAVPYDCYTQDGPGLQVFHFNGANPITAYSGILTAAPIDAIQWDSNNHLYALSNSTKKLYAYTVTSSSITAVPGSPYTIAATPNALVVMPTSTACSAPSSDGVHICDPTSGASVSSPVLVEASARISGTIARTELWVDGVKKYAATSSTQLNTSVSLAAGSHRFAVLAINTAGQKWENAVNATVK
jgi:hypothetical protein